MGRSHEPPYLEASNLFTLLSKNTEQYFVSHDKSSAVNSRDVRLSIYIKYLLLLLLFLYTLKSIWLMCIMSLHKSSRSSTNGPFGRVGWGDMGRSHGPSYLEASNLFTLLSKNTEHGQLLNCFRKLESSSSSIHTEVYLVNVYNVSS
jgi:hypothetical protein